ncbi:MAG: cyclophilin-like fold protein [Bacillota bacterium]
MPRRIAFIIGEHQFTGTLLETPVAEAIYRALPLEAAYSTWGDEIYFDTGVKVAPGPSRETVELGDIGYWPPGRALCLFYGPTPVSGPGEIRPASPVAVLGRLDGGPLALKRVRGSRIRVTALD